MSQPTVLKRSEIAQQHKWNAESIFPTPEAWQEEAERLKESLPQMEKFRGRLGESPAVLSEALLFYEEIYRRFGKFIIYGMVGHEVDTTDQEATRRSGIAMGMYGRFAAAGAFMNPELLSIGEDTLKQWMEQEPSLKVYAHSFEDLFRQQAHVRSAEVEELLGGLATPFRGAATTASMMTDADFRFEPATGVDGQKIPVTQGTLDEILASPDRDARRTAWENYMDTFLAHKNSMASNLATSIQQNVYMARARRYQSTLEASLFENNIPVEVFHNLVETFRAHLPTWHRYWAIRRKALKVDELHPYDIWAPLTDTRPEIPYDQAVEWICAGLKPMGDVYVNTIRKGCLEDRWVDVYPNLGKSSSQFSTGWPGTFPFIVLNYDNTIFSLSTLAHELGHSMHSYLTWQNQPVVYSNYSLFAAEVASNFHQAMVRGYLLESNPDPVFQINVIEEAMSNFHRYFFIMPTLARFELEMHEKAERGEGLTADDMIRRMAELFTEGYGSEVHVDPERVGITWATFGHLYQDYYVYQYTTGISGANALAASILKGEPGAVERYQDFLKAGSSVYPLQALQQAGVDLASPKPIEAAFAVLGGLVDRLEKLIA